GALLDFAAGTFTDTPASSIAGQGNLSFSGATATLSGLVNLTGLCTVSGGTANLVGAFICTNNTLSLTGPPFGGTANFNGNSIVSPGILNLNAGALSGSNVVTVLNQLNWSGGTMSGAGKTVIAPGATLTISNANAVVLN